MKKRKGLLFAAMLFQASMIAYAGEEDTYIDNTIVEDSTYISDTYTEDSICIEESQNTPVLLDNDFHQGWSLEEGEWYYYDQYGQRMNGWQWIDGEWYYLDGTDVQNPGIMLKDCKRVIGESTYCFSQSGAMQTGWIKYPEGWYYADASGALSNGWILLNGIWYYLDGANTEYPYLMVESEQKEISGKIYYFASDGAMQVGWIKCPEGWYYADGSGAFVNGWVLLNGTWYYLDGANVEYPYLMVESEQKEISGSIYFFSQSGAMQVGWVKYPEGWYYANESGALVTGWVSVGGTWYYLNPYNEEYPGLMISGMWMEIGGERYYFYANGAMAQNWILIDNNWYFLSSDGAMRTGWQLIENRRYYFYPEDGDGIIRGTMAVNTTIDGWTIGESGIALLDTEKKIEEIKKYTYVPYIYGGTSTNGWDCSGFTQWALRYLGVEIPRTSYEQAVGGSYINPYDMSQWKPGDILVYSSRNGSLGHVALYLGDGKLMHALNTKYGTLIQGVTEYEIWDSGTTLFAVRRYF